MFLTDNYICDLSLNVQTLSKSCVAMKQGHIPSQSYTILNNDFFLVFYHFLLLKFMQSWIVFCPMSIKLFCQSILTLFYFITVIYNIIHMIMTGIVYYSLCLIIFNRDLLICL